MKHKDPQERGSQPLRPKTVGRETVEPGSPRLEPPRPRSLRPEALKAYVTDLEAQSESISKRYCLLPLEVTQDKMAEYLTNNPQRDYVLRGSRLESSLDDSGESLRSTLAICSYLSPYMPNRRLALVHSTGTGKTRKSLLAAMQYNRDITLVAVHNIQLGPFVTEISGQGRVCKAYPWFRKRMDVITCRSVAAAVAKKDTRRLDYLFKDRVVIVDEMHHIRSTGSKRASRVSLFESMVNVLSTYKDSIVLFLSATPLVDKGSELEGVYNLLRPDTKAGSNMQHLAYELRGYVSFFSKANLPTRNVRVRCLMARDGKQWELYQKHQEDKGSVHSKTMAISRFMTLDDEEASECETPTQVLIDSMLEGQEFSSTEERYAASIEALRYISVKVYQLVLHLRSHPHHPKFIFDSWKKRGGVERIVDVLCMPCIGYHCVSDLAEARDTSRGPKILALHRLPTIKSHSSVARDLIDLYNSEENQEGDLISLLVAAPMFSESMSLRNARECHIMMPPWNTTSRIQISGRVNRRTSLRHLPKEQRVITNYTYVLYKPDGGSTIESTVERSARLKYQEIIPLIATLGEFKIETLSNGTGLCSSMDPMPSCLSKRVNMRVRMHTPTVSYREISIGTDIMLAELEKRESIYELMRDISLQEVGYTRLINMAIQAIEQTYIKQVLKQPITPKQEKLLSDVSPAFIRYEGYHTHVLYFSNDDTVEYQRLARAERRVVRVLDTDSNVWIDVKDQGVINIVAEAYESNTVEFSESIRPKWHRYGFYASKFLLTSCYRLVRYKSELETTRMTKRGDVDRRKVSRGEKWQYYSKGALIDLLSKFVPVTRVQALLLLRKVSVESLFLSILDHMQREGMVLVLPI